MFYSHEREKKYSGLGTAWFKTHNISWDIFPSRAFVDRRNEDTISQSASWITQNCSSTPQRWEHMLERFLSIHSDVTVLSELTPAQNGDGWIPTVCNIPPNTVCILACIDDEEVSHIAICRMFYSIWPVLSGRHDGASLGVVGDAYCDSENG